ncbi:branched-chain amino acid ABC transporter permease [Chelatococcus asaccharovorans]|uniref:Branched-chain amino acid transport system permease protein n=1 Tax=Chelatococcus asaccharovorans TaxID=28210 RepID=A0A2V3U309_9HYPH|nr:branched-chain amino acid ABC transporter permease [Chelatococcus asaccharovorans]MBS7704922.1 branched-chain amino acid ABC transporter permease [Chelatococcus asaccharovorans]PXW51385.1 branched-chain amino acid transport system permease protein [Chelatococcus asaccharovorans]CAH1651190.1 Branched-chain amino acid transport system permease protein [Chelatococcus asaccharovorans]CAH1686656.1 Branched-chain amino acid transport system permease protein [Chelatococcus asaccharovorans]
MFYAQLIVNGLVQGLIVGLAALAVTLVFGVARFANAATGDTMTFGAYAALIGHKATGSLVVAGGAAVGATALLSLTVYALVFRKLAGRSVVALLVTSIGVGFLLRSVLGIVFGHNQQLFTVPLVRPIRFNGLIINPFDLQLAAVAAVALVGVFLVLYATPIGRRMRAVADNRELALVSGIRPERVMIALWLLVGAVTGVAGMMLGMKTIVSPELGWEMLLPAFAAAILGGIGSPVGAVLAGLLLGVAQELSTPFVGFTYKLSISFVVLLLVLLVRPRGLFGRLEGVR